MTNKMWLQYRISSHKYITGRNLRRMGCVVYLVQTKKCDSGEFVVMATPRCLFVTPKKHKSSPITSIKLIYEYIRRNYTNVELRQSVLREHSSWPVNCYNLSYTWRHTHGVICLSRRHKDLSRQSSCDTLYVSHTGRFSRLQYIVYDDIHLFVYT